MPESLSFDLVIIGGGPAGYVGAIRAAQLGLSVACVERDQLGGICNNWGCIPTKALLAEAELYSKLRHGADDWGIHVEGLSHDWQQVISRSRDVAGLGVKGVAALFKKNKVTHVHGHAKVVAGGPECRVEVYDPDNQKKLTHTLTCKHVVVATGARPRALPGAPFDGDRIISYKEAMSLPQQPKDLVIVGAGAIGMEFAYFYNAFGTKVTVVEMMDRLLPIEDEEVSKAIARAFKKQGIICHTATKTTGVKKTDTGVEVTISQADDESKSQTLTADRVLVAIGVQGNFDNLFDEKLGLAVEKGHIKVDYKKPGADYQTSLPGVYAVGDVIGPPWLAHVASEECIVCVERIAGQAEGASGGETTDIDYDSIPGCTYCHPQVASVGLTEQACRDLGMKADEDYTVGKFPLLASGKARAMGETQGFVKLIAGKVHGEILGCHMVGENATELIAEMCLARRLEATADEVIATMHAHPTLSESVHEAALGTQGRMIHN
jgi:dihydrolipoyl dehydrogenase